MPASAAVDLGDAVAAVERACAERRSRGQAITYLQSMYLPTEDMCFCVFEAPSSDAVRAVNEAAAFRLDRITEAVVMTPSSPRSFT